MTRWWRRVRPSVKMLIIPLLGLQFIRTFLIPNPFDVLVLFGFFAVFLGLLFDQI